MTRGYKYNNRAADAVLLPWLCTTMAAVFVAWTATSSLAEMQNPDIGLARYAVLLVPTMIATGLLCGFLFWVRRERLLAQISRGLTLSYLSMLKIAGFSLAPAAALGLAIAAVAGLRSRNDVSLTISLVLHASGTLTGFYLAANLQKYTATWPLLRNVVRNMIRLAAG